MKPQLRMCGLNFAHIKTFPSGWEASLSRFVGLFRRYGYICRQLSGGTWVTANEKWGLTDTEVIKAISKARDKILLGTRAGKTVDLLSSI